MKSAAVGRFFAHCNRKSLAAANTQSRFSASNTVLLTCVIGNPPLRPHPTFSQVFPAMANFRPNGIFRFGVASRAQHRFVSVLRPSSVCLSCPRVYGIGVYYGISIFSFTYGREGAPLHDDLLYSVHYDIRFFAVWQANSSYISVFFRKMRKFLVLRLAFTLKMVGTHTTKSFFGGNYNENR